MPIVAAYLYRDGERAREISVEDAVDCPEDRSTFVWIDAADPTQEEMETLQRRYGLHPLAVEAALKLEQSPKVNIYGEQLFMIACSAHLDGEHIVFGETAIFVGHSHVISVRPGDSDDQMSLRDQLEAAPSLLAHGVDYVLYAIVELILDTYLPLVAALEEEVIAMEQHTLESFLGRDEVRRIFSLRHDLTRFAGLLRAMGEVTSKLTNLDLPCLDADVKPYFSDGLDHIRHVQRTVDDLRDVMTAVFEISSLLEQQRTGAITRQLAAWAAILAVPTAIAGIYGMNFDYIPELKMPGGYFVVVGLMVAVCTVLYIRFRRSGWI